MEQEKKKASRTYLCTSNCPLRVFFSCEHYNHRGEYECGLLFGHPTVVCCIRQYSWFRLMYTFILQTVHGSMSMVPWRQKREKRLQKEIPDFFSFFCFLFSVFSSTSFFQLFPSTSSLPFVPPSTSLPPRSLFLFNLSSNQLVHYYSSFSPHNSLIHSFLLSINTHPPFP